MESSSNDSGKRPRANSNPFASGALGGVRSTTRKVAATLNPRAILGRMSSISSLRGSQTGDADVEGPEDPEEEPTVLSGLANETPNPLADLDSLLPVADTFGDEDGFVDLCNDMLVLNAHEHRDPTVRSINIPGSKIFVSPHQFYHAFSLLSQKGRDLNGAILADEAGTGKSYIFIAAFLLRALAFESERSVRLFWEEQRTGTSKKRLGKQVEQHLPEGGNGRSCPGQKHGAVVCYCVPGCFTRLICDTTPRGVSVLYCALETWPDIVNIVQTSALSSTFYQVCLVHKDAPIRFTRPLQPLVKTLSRGAGEDLSNMSPSSFIFITTLDNPRLWNVFSQGALNVGLCIIDEAHQVLRTNDSLTVRMAKEYCENGAEVWFVTATPFSQCPLKNWAPAIELIAPSRRGAMQDLTAAFETATASGADDDFQSFKTQWNLVFDKKLVVRHLGSSLFLGKPIAGVQKVVPRVVSRQTPAQHRDAVQQLADQVAPKDFRLHDTRQRGLLYLVSMFPAAAQVVLDNPIALDNLTIRDSVRDLKKRSRVEESDTLQRLSSQISQDSPKLDYILEELHRMASDRRERTRVENPTNPKTGAGEDLKLKKMVIITPTAVCAIFLYLALARVRQDVAVLHPWLSSADKQKIITQFQSLSAARLVTHTRVLVAPFAVAGTGLNLQVASYQILTSPLLGKANQVQAFARTNRAGQRLRPVTHKILVLEDSPVDRIVLARHAARLIESDPFQISQPLRLSGGSWPVNKIVPVGEIETPSRPSRSSDSLGSEAEDYSVISPQLDLAGPRAEDRTERVEGSFSVTPPDLPAPKRALRGDGASPTAITPFDGPSNLHQPRVLNMPVTPTNLPIPSDGPGGEWETSTGSSRSVEQRIDPFLEADLSSNSSGGGSSKWRIVYTPGPFSPLAMNFPDLSPTTRSMIPEASVSDVEPVAGPSAPPPQPMSTPSGNLALRDMAFPVFVPTTLSAIPERSSHVRTAIVSSAPRPIRIDRIDEGDFTIYCSDQSSSGSQDTGDTLLHITPEDGPALRTLDIVLPVASGYTPTVQEVSFAVSRARRGNPPMSFQAPAGRRAAEYRRPSIAIVEEDDPHRGGGLPGAFHFRPVPWPRQESSTAGVEEEHDGEAPSSSPPEDSSPEEQAQPEEEKPFSVTDLPPPVGTGPYSTAEMVDQLDEDSHDIQTLAQRREDALSRGGSSRRIGQQFDRYSSTDQPGAQSEE